MKVVSNSSPLIFLSAIGLLDILKTEFGEILIPETVYEEVTSKNLKGSNEVKHADWIRVFPIENKISLSFLPMLDKGEEKASQHVKGIGCAYYADWDYQQWIEQSDIYCAEERECHCVLPGIYHHQGHRYQEGEQYLFALPYSCPPSQHIIYHADYGGDQYACHSSKHTVCLSTTKCVGLRPDPGRGAALPAGGYSQLKRCHLLQHKLWQYEFFENHPCCVIPAFCYYARQRWGFGAGRGGEGKHSMEGAGQHKYHIINIYIAELHESRSDWLSKNSFIC